MMVVKRWLQLLWILTCLTTTLGDGDLVVNFIYFNSSSDKLNDFKNHCDINLLGELESHCDPVFHIELIRDGAFGETLFSYQQKNARLFENKIEVHFFDKIDSMQNPLKQTIQMEVPGDVYLLVRVEDNDEDMKNDVMDIFVKLLDYGARTLTQVSLYNPRSEHWLKLEYRYICKPNYFGPVCTRHCEMQNDDVKGHYSCTEDGRKKCLNGWKNPSLDCKVPVWCRWC